MDAIATVEMETDHDPVGCVLEFAIDHAKNDGIEPEQVTLTVITYLLFALCRVLMHAGLDQSEALESLRLAWLDELENLAERVEDSGKPRQ